MDTNRLFSTLFNLPTRGSGEGARHRLHGMRPSPNGDLTTPGQRVGSQTLARLIKAVSAKQKMNAHQRLAEVRHALERLESTGYEGWGNDPGQHRSFVQELMHLCTLVERVLACSTTLAARAVIVESNGLFSFAHEWQETLPRTRKVGRKLVLYAYHHVAEQELRTAVKAHALKEEGMDPAFSADPDGRTGENG